ncbi:Exosome component 10 [Taenia crassiceps]|uniref:Exosome component 10 n=1 Tax=Taenia crassiceps TaxID=6207 RepID=A0ABR4QQM5_9CEST
MHGNSCGEGDVAGASRRLVSVRIQDVIDELNGRANIMDAPQPKSLEEKFCTIVSINDEIVDRITGVMDREEFPDRANNSNAQNFLVTLDGEQNDFSPFDFDSSKRRGDVVGRSTTKLFASKHIVRPQNFFTIRPDNSHTPFTPILKSKPNAIVDLQDCTLEADPETGDYIHPYLPELEAYGRDLENYKYDTSTLNPGPLPLEETPLDIIDTVDGLHNMLEELSTASEIAVDLEHHSYRTFLGMTCLIQLSTRTKDYIIDALALHDHLGQLNCLFTNPKIVKVFHGSNLDLMWLQRDFGVYIVNLFDTGQAARTLRFPRFSLAYLLQRFVGIIPNKAFQLADWRIRPLPKALIDYARSDTHYLLYVAELLRGLLAAQDLLTEVLERSQELCLRIYKKPKFNTLEYLSKSHAVVKESLDKRQLYALKYLCILRDTIARKEDESHAFVLPNHMLHQIAEKLPKERTGMYACCNPVPPLLRKYASDFHQIVLNARNSKHIEQEIDADIVMLGSVTPANSTLNVVPSHITVSRCAPHDTLHLTPQQIPTSNNFCADSLRRNCLTRPSVFGRRFAQPPRPLCEAFMDPSRVMLQKILDAVKPIQVSDPIPVVEQDLSFMSTAATPTASSSEIKEDPLFKPQPAEYPSISGGTALSPIKLTAAEAIEVEDLGAKFRPGSASFGRSAQSRALANLKNRRQQRDHSPPPPQRKEAFDQKRLAGSQEDDTVDTETDVVILRDEKLKRLPKGTKPQVRQSHLSGLTTNLTGDSPSQSDPSSQPRPQTLTRLEIPITPEIQAAIHQTVGCSGRRKRRSRGGRGGGTTGAGGITLRGSLSSSFSLSGCASFTPQPQKKRDSNN